MAESFLDRLSHAWNAFIGSDYIDYSKLGASYSSNPSRPSLQVGSERSIITSIYSRIAIDVSSIAIKHVRLDENKRYVETISSGLNECLTLEANKDQSGRAFIMDIVISMFDEGAVALVPIDTTLNPNITGSYDILSLRTGKILEWFPNSVRVEIYNDNTGNKEIKVIPKGIVGIVENPLYAVMNEPNSTLKRLIYKLNILDAIDAQSGSGKLDLIIQLPYVIKSAARKIQAQQRRADIEEQLSGSKYGIAYTEATERVTQLNRPAENQLMAQIEYLTRMLYSQLGVTESVIDGTADEKTMLNYYNRTIEPILGAIRDAMLRSFITKTGRTQGQSIEYFKDPFKLVPISDIADMADKFTRNEILTSNEIRGILGLKPDKDPKSDQLLNKNISQSGEGDNNKSNAEDPLIEEQPENLKET